MARTFGAPQLNNAHMRYTVQHTRVMFVVQYCIEFSPFLSLSILCDLNTSLALWVSLQ